MYSLKLPHQKPINNVIRYHLDSLTDHYKLSFGLLYVPHPIPILILSTGLCNLFCTLSSFTVKVNVILAYGRRYLVSLMSESD